MDRDRNQVAEISPLGYFSYTAYNQDNQPVTQVDADGRTTASTYDPAGRLVTQTWTAADGAQTNVLTYSYDPVGNMTVAGNAYGDYTFTYDSANRVYTQTDPFNLTLTFGYDANGNVTSVADSAGGTVTSIFNADNQLTSRRFATTANGTPASVQLRMDLAYTPAGQIATETRYADTAGTDLLGQTQFTYDPSGNVTEIEHTNAASTVLLEYQYQCDAADRVSSETETYNGTPTTTNYGYDASNELTNANSATYTYDANGNRTMTGYQTGADNELLSDGTWNYAYDPAGNMISQVGISNGLSWYYTYLCPCQLAGGDFSRFCERFSQGTGWCSLSQRSMAASQIGWRVAAAHRSSWFPADRQWKQRYRGRKRGRKRGENGTGPILTRWEVFDNLWACLVPQESLRAEWCFMFSTGVLRMQVFEKAGDYEAFERVLKETLEEVPMRVCAYCLMPSHWHILLWPERDGDLARFMQRLTITHVRRWQENRHYVGLGHVYQGRYKSFPVEEDEHFLAVVRYVERNALRANLVVRAEEWRWSSLWRRCRGTAEDKAVLAAWPLEVPEDWLERVNRADNESELEALRRSVQRGRPYRATEWQKRIAKRLGLESAYRSPGRPGIARRDAEASDW